MKFEIEKNKENFDLDRIMYLLKQSYWADKRTRETVQKSIENSMCFYVIEKQNNEIVGFARVISDYATAYYLCDVIVDKNYRSNGIGKMIVEAVVSDDNLKNLKGILRTEDAHGLYEKYDFCIKSEKFMERISERKKDE